MSTEWSSRLAWIVGLSGRILGVAVFALVPFTVPALSALAAGLEPSLHILNLNVDGGSMIFSLQPPLSLTATPWRVQAYNNGRDGVVSVLPDVELTAAFGEDGSVNGDAGCNGYRGPYSIAGDRITFGSIISTRRACLSEPLNQQEQAFLAALNASRSYGLVGDRLTLHDAAGATQIVLIRPSIQPVPSPAQGEP